MYPLARGCKGSRGDTAWLWRNLAANPGDFRSGLCNDLMCLKQWKSPPNEKGRQEAWSKTKQAWWPGSRSPREAASLTRIMLSGFSALPSSWLWIFCTRTMEKTGDRGRMQRLPESLTQWQPLGQDCLVVESWVQMQPRYLTNWMTWGKSLHLPEPRSLQRSDRSNKRGKRKMTHCPAYIGKPLLLFITVIWVDFLSAFCFSLCI